MRKILFPVWMMQLITLYFACKRRLSQKVKLKDIQILKTFVECFQLTNDKQEYKHNFDFPKILRIFKRWIQQNYRNKNFTNSQEYFVKFYQYFNSWRLTTCKIMWKIIVFLRKKKIKSDVICFDQKYLNYLLI